MSVQVATWSAYAGIEPTRLRPLRGPLRAGLAALSLALAAAGATAPPAQALYRQNSTELWPDGQVRVCWEAGSDTRGEGDPNPARAHPDFAELSRVIRHTVDNGWGRAANIRFEGWNDCASRSPEGNAGVVAIHWERGIGDASGLGFQRGQWTRMRLDPDLLRWDEALFRGVILHEFGHALGFSHEMDRPDWTPPPVGNPCVGNPQRDSDPEANLLRTPADPASVMAYTYCLGTSHGVLSPWDIVGAQAAYGPKRPGSLVGSDNRCLDVPNADPRSGAPMQVFDCHGRDNQRWRWRDDASLSVGTPLGAPEVNLDVAGASREPGARVQLFHKRDPASSNQQWTFEGVRLVGIGGKCADVRDGRFSAGTVVQIFRCHGGPEQDWTVTTDGDIKLSRAPGNLCLDVPDAHAAPNNVLQIFPCHGGEAQRFELTEAGEIRFRGLCLDVRGGGVSDGSVVQLHPCRGAPANQRWHISGPVRGHGPQCLDLAGGRGANNTAVVMNPCTPASRSQEWAYHFAR